MTHWDDPSPISRREALGALGIAAGAGLLSAFTSPLAAASGPGAFRPDRAPIIRTLLGDLAPGDLPAGAVLMHEHLSMKYPPGATQHFTDDIPLMVEEVKLARADGVALIVDAGHEDMERDLGALRRIAAEAGMPIVASGGYYMQRTYPPGIAAKSAEEIARELAAEAARDRLGAFGEIGQQEGELTPDERKMFQAIGRVQALTGLPVFTHTPYTGRRPGNVPRDAALRQLDLLLEAGANPASVAIGHVCCLDDPAADIAIQIARRGAFVAFDRVTLNLIMPDSERVRMAVALIDAGHADRLLLASDFYAASSLKTRGGAGLAQTVTVFAPMLREAGVPEGTIRLILEENPKRFLAFEPVA